MNSAGLFAAPRSRAARIGLAVVMLVTGLFSRSARSAELTEEAVLASIERAKMFLISQQGEDGSWQAPGGRYDVGVTSLVLLALLSSDMKLNDAPISKGLSFLRSVREPNPTMTYEASLMLMALVAANDGQRDKARILMLAQKLENWQIKVGVDAGSWSYGAAEPPGRPTGDRSNAQYAVLGLREAAQAGIAVDRKTWERIRQHWTTQQNPDGGWSYSASRGAEASTGSMTVAGIATLEIADSMLGSDAGHNRDGTPNCCGDPKPNESLDRAIRWLSERFAVGHNPGSSTWLLYYLYGMERAGRLSGVRFFGMHDWYREGAQYLVERQSQRDGSWPGVHQIEGNPTIGTSFALLFLSKGLSPVLFNKLKYGDSAPGHINPADGGNWNRHPNDVRNLTDVISGLEGWPRLVTWQTVDIRKVAQGGGVNDLLQSPILYLSGRDAISLEPRNVELIREYISAGGFIFAVANCNGTGGEFDKSFRALVARMFPSGEAQLKRLTAEHPIFRSEYVLNSDTVELWGVDFGCRTAIVYSPDDISCLWDNWTRHDPPGRAPQVRSMIERATRVGVNVAAYATGREPPRKPLNIANAAHDGAQDNIERGLLQIAKLRHTGGWDVAPNALRNLLVALNQKIGLAASTRVRNLPATDPNIFNYPILYMHGRNRFNIGQQERDQLRSYLSRGGVLFADACCGSPAFDASFREFIAQLCPDREFKRIPPGHELFTSKVGYDIPRVKRRTVDAHNPDQPLNANIVEGEPFLEGIEIDGRYAVIYSKFDISCALEQQASVACEGYVVADAVRIGMNVVLYSMLQNVTFGEAKDVNSKK